MPSGDRDYPPLGEPRGVLVLGKCASAWKRGPVCPQEADEWNNHSKEQTYLRIGVTVPITQEVGVINATWGQIR
jgi:hypothetical protein